jgi:hypothetical protein
MDRPGISGDAKTYPPTMNGVIRVRRHVDLTTTELDALESLFDGEYPNTLGTWNPDAPYGYSPAETHILTFRAQALAAHIGFQRRLMSKGSRPLLSVVGLGSRLRHGTLLVSCRPDVRRRFCGRPEPHLLRKT